MAELDGRFVANAARYARQKGHLKDMPGGGSDDILNVGGFSDAVFDVIEPFTAGRYGPRHWVEASENMG